MVSNRNADLAEVNRTDFKCPFDYCSECCAASGTFGIGKSSSKFKCVLKKASDLPRRRTCDGLAKRKEVPTQSKVECEVLPEDGDINTIAPKCSKKATCCCPKALLDGLTIGKLKSNPASNKVAEIKQTQCFAGVKDGRIDHGNGLVEIFEHKQDYIFDSLGLFPTIYFCDGPRAPASLKGTGYHERTKAILTGECKTDLRGLEKVGTSFECPADMIVSDPENGVECQCPVAC